MSSLGFKGKKVFVYGLGKSGYATTAALYADGADVFIYDAQGKEKTLESNQGKKILSKNKVNFADINDINFDDFDAFFKSPGISMEDSLVQKAMDSHLQIEGDVDLLYRREKDATFIGITGTNGKSTTTALIGHVLETANMKVATGGNLGTACLNLPKGQDFYVLELSSYQLETMHEAKMNVGVLLNLTPDHLERHGSMSVYLEEKKRIFNGVDNMVRVLDIDNPELEELSANVNAITVTVTGKNASLSLTEEGVLRLKDGASIHMKEFTHLPGKHNWQNIACAYAATKDMVHLETFKKAVSSFRALPHRMEEICIYNNIHFYNDSKATNAESVIPALESVENIFWICGGLAKAEGVEPCLKHLKNVRHAFVIGKERDTFLKSLDGKVPLDDCGTMDIAVYKAFEKCKEAGFEKATILLSPASASWDQFDNFEHRGDVFVSLCHEVIERDRAENG